MFSNIHFFLVFMILFCYLCTMFNFNINVMKQAYLLTVQVAGKERPVVPSVYTSDEALLAAIKDVKKQLSKEHSSIMFGVALIDLENE